MLMILPKITFSKFTQLKLFALHSQLLVEDVEIRDVELQAIKKNRKYKRLFWLF